MSPKPKVGLACALLLLASSLPAPRAQERQKPALPAAGPARQATPAAPAEPKFAVLIGINKYNNAGDPKTHINNLEGPVNDVAEMRRVLTENYKFADDAEHILELKDGAATRAAILDSFDKFLIPKAAANPGATVVFYYAGHGSRLPDKDGEEADGYDETLVAADSDKAGSRDVIDDEIDQRFEKLADSRLRTKNITFILDSCHSGSATRAVGMTPRNVERDLKPGPVRAKARGDLGNEVLPRDRRYTTISGCLPEQLTYETFVERKDGTMRAQGLLTRHLVQALELNSRVTYRDLMETVSGAVTHENSNQTPQVEGDIDRVLFGGADERVQTGIKINGVERAGKNQKVVIDAGKVQGIREGSIVAVYKNGTALLKGPEGLLATGVVTQVGSFESTAEVVKATAADVTTRDRVAPITPNFGTDAMRVALDARGSGPSQQLISAVAAQLKGSSLVRVVQNAPRDPLADRPARWDMAVVRGTGAEYEAAKQKIPTRGDRGTPAADEEIYYIVTPEGWPLYDFWRRADDERAADDIADVLQKRARQENVRLLSNKGSALNDAVHISLVPFKDTGRKEPNDRGELVPVYEEDTQPGKVLASSIASGNPVMQVGDRFKIKVENLSDQELYVTILSLGTDGEIDVFYPPRGSAEKLAPKTKETGGVLYSQRLKVDPPLGLNTLLVIVATKANDFGFLEQPGIPRDVASRGDQKPLEWLMRQAFQGIQRTVRDDEGLPKDWATKRLDLVIRERAQ